MKAAIAKAATAIAGATLLSGCIAMHDHRGSVIDTELVSAIQPGVDNKDSVQRTLGRPTFTGEFGDSDWYYLSRDTETLAFRSPRVKDQTLLHVRFDAAGNVASIDRSGRELIAKIDQALVRPLHPYTSGLLRSLPRLSQRKSTLPSIPGRVPSLAAMPEGCRFRPRCTHAAAGCEQRQVMTNGADERNVRCHRAPDLVLPGAVA